MLLRFRLQQVGTSARTLMRTVRCVLIATMQCVRAALRSYFEKVRSCIENSKGAGDFDETRFGNR